MTQSVEQLEPKNLWLYFARLSAIPRCSKSEAAAAEWIASVGREHDVAVEVDAVGNVLMRVQASPGHESAPTVVLQGHIDMVCEKNSSVKHDFESDPIRPIVDGDIVRADGTTLGADNGIGVATALALLDEPDIVHGPLELLFTVDEETGLTGANALKAGLLSGRILLNLDSEDLGIFTIGSAGGRDTTITLKAPRAPRPDAELLRLEVTGLQGGHSGQDIHLNRGNSIRILGRVILAGIEETGSDDICVGYAAGGSKRNAIPRESWATLAVPAGQTDAFRQAALQEALRIKSQLEGIDDDLRVSLRPLSEPELQADGTVCSPEDSRRLVHLINALPHGVLAMSTEMENLVETSTNMGVLTDLGDGHRITFSTRSSIAEALSGVLMQIRAVSRLANAEVTHGEGYPAWKPKLGTPLLQTVESVYERLFAEKPTFEAIHAGLECGLFLGQYPDLQVVSFGPDIREPHSPNERVYIESVAKFWAFTTALLAELAAAQGGSA
jgi:dipeptidase D